MSDNFVCNKYDNDKVYFGDSAFASVDPYSLADFNPLKKIAKEWMLITTAYPDNNEKKCVNAMTASWGGIGELWNKPVAFCFVRPQRFTFELMENCEMFSLCFLNASYRSALKICGTESGRNTDKLKKSGLDSNFYNGVPVIRQSDLILICRRLYCDFLDKDNFLSKELVEQIYPTNDFHRMYICEISDILIRNN